MIAMALLKQWCGPEEAPIEGFRHRFLEFDEFFSCEFCGGQMSHAQARQWMSKYATAMDIDKAGRREGGAE